MVEAGLATRLAVDGPRSSAGPSLQVVERSFAILEAFTEAHPEWSLSDLARAVELPTPTTHRILSVLARLGYLSKNEDTRRYRLGGAALRLGERARSLGDVRGVALQPLQKLLRATGETALLTALNPERDHSVCLERVESTHPLRLSVQPGRQLPLHAGASQKALLAFMPEKEIEALLARPLKPLCAATITDPGGLRRDLQAARERGWAASHEETNVGVWGIAIPVLSDAEVVCAVGIAGPSARLSGDVVRRHVPAVHRAAAAVARAIGFIAPPVSITDPLPLHG